MCNSRCERWKRFSLSLDSQSFRVFMRGALSASEVCVCTAPFLGKIGGFLALSGLCALQTCRHPSLPTQPPTFKAALTSSVYPSISFPSLIVALGPHERTNKANAPLRKRSNCKWGRGEDEWVKQGDKRDEGWGGRVARGALKETDTWEEKSGIERRLENYNLSQLWSFFFFPRYFLILLALAFHPWLLIILVVTYDCYTPTVVIRSPFQTQTKWQWK